MSIEEKLMDMLYRIIHHKRPSSFSSTCLIYSIIIYFVSFIIFCTFFQSSVHAEGHVDEFGRISKFIPNPAVYPPNYEERKRNNPHYKELNVLIYDLYTKKRFGMPEKWLSDEIEGAHAVTWRMEPTGRKRCHDEGKDKVCVPAYECVMTFLMDMTTDIGINGGRALTVENPIDFKPWKGSLAMLGWKNPSLKEKWENAFGLKSKVNLIVTVDGKGQFFPINVVQYQMYGKGVMQVVGLVNGRAGLLPYDSPREIVFQNAEETILHKIKLPFSFWQRVGEYHAERLEVSEKNWLGGKEEDNNIWLYSKAFAQKYNMPEKGISKELNGADAVSFRVEYTGTEQCGYFGEKEKCSPDRYCLFDLYIPENVPIAYKTKYRMGTTADQASRSFLEMDPRTPFRFFDTRDSGFESVSYGFYSKGKMFGGGGYTKTFIRPEAWSTDFHFGTFSFGCSSNIGGGGSDYGFALKRSEPDSSKSEFPMYYEIQITEKFIVKAGKYLDDFDHQNSKDILKMVKKKFGWK